MQLLWPEDWLVAPERKTVLWCIASHTPCRGGQITLGQMDGAPQNKQPQYSCSITPLSPKTVIPFPLKRTPFHAKPRTPPPRDPLMLPGAPVQLLLRIVILADGELARSRLTLPQPLRVIFRTLRPHHHPFRHEKGGIKADTKLTDERLLVVFLRGFQQFLEFGGS